MLSHTFSSRKVAENRRPRVIEGGFTLVELLVVVSVLLMLSALLLPVFQSAKESGKRSQALVQMKQIGGSIHLYSSASDERFPDGLGANCYSLLHKFKKGCPGLEAESAIGRQSFWSQIQGHIGDRRILRSDLDRIQPWLAADGTHQQSWWKETDFAQHYGMSFEYALGVLGQPPFSGDRSSSPMLYSLFEIVTQSNSKKGAKLVLGVDLNVTLLTSEKLGRELM